MKHFAVFLIAVCSALAFGIGQHIARTQAAAEPVLLHCVIESGSNELNPSRTRR